MEVEKEFETVKSQVRKAMANEERCRNDDKYLTWKVMRNYTNIYIKFEDFEKLPSFETIRRTRQLLQNKEGVLLPTDPAVRVKRQEREREVKEYLRG